MDNDKYQGSDFIKAGAIDTIGLTLAIGAGIFIASFAAAPVAAVLCAGIAAGGVISCLTNITKKELRG